MVLTRRKPLSWARSYRLFKISKIIELPKFSRLICIVKVTDEPVCGIFEDIFLDTRHLLCDVD